MKTAPDIVFMVLDTQRADHLSCYGYAAKTSPYLDDLAHESTLFMHAVAPAQWTVPTHASMFTGVYPSQHMVYQMDSVLSATVPTLAERLKQAGYYTAGFSHNPLIGKVKNGLNRGFDVFTNYDYFGAGLLSVHLSRPDMPVGWMAKLRRTARFLLAESLGFSQQTPLSALAPFTLPLWHGIVEKERGSKAANVAHSLTAVSQLLENRSGVDREQPIFAFINLMGTHVPYAPPDWAVEQFLPNAVDQRTMVQLLQNANNWQVDVRNWLEMEPPHSEYEAVINGIYDAEVAEQDAQIGRFLTQLRSSGAFDNTFFIITADHGDHLGEKQRLNHAFGIYGQLTHVPLIVRDPSGFLPQGSSVNYPVSTRHIFHTVLTTAGAATPEETKLSLENVTENQPVFVDGFPLEWAIRRVERYRPGLVQKSGYDQFARAVYADSFKLIAMGQHYELYDIEKDMAETTDLSEQLPERVKQMQNQLNQFAQRTKPMVQEITRQEEDETILKQLRSLGYLE